MVNILKSLIIISLVSVNFATFGMLPSGTPVPTGIKLGVQPYKPTNIGSEYFQPISGETPISKEEYASGILECLNGPETTESVEALKGVLKAGTSAGLTPDMRFQADGDCKYFRGDTPLIHAIRFGGDRQKMIAALLDANADPDLKGYAFSNTRGKCEDSPLSIAARYENLSLAQQLLEAGANPNLTLKNGEFGKTALENTRSRETSSGLRTKTYNEMVELFLYNGYIPHEPNMLEKRHHEFQESGATFVEGISEAWETLDLRLQEAYDAHKADWERLNSVD